MFCDPEKRARFRTQKWGRNSRFTSPASKFVAPFLGPWPGRPPVRKVYAGRRQLTLKIQCFFAIGCEMLRRYWFHNVGTWCGRLFSYSYAVPFPGHRFRASFQAKAPRLGKFRDTTFSSKITLAPFPPRPPPSPSHRPRCISLSKAPIWRPQRPRSRRACPKGASAGMDCVRRVQTVGLGVRSIRAMAGHSDTGKDWASRASAHWQGARLILLVLRRARQTLPEGLGLEESRSQITKLRISSKLIGSSNVSSAAKGLRFRA